MPNINIPPDMIDALRPMVEDAWECHKREQGKKPIGATEVVIRTLSKVLSDKGKQAEPRIGFIPR